MAKQSKLGKILLIIAVIAVVIILAAEVVLRFTISHKFKESVKEQAAASGIENPSDPSISFGLSPLVLGVLTQNIHHMEMETPDTAKVSWPNGPEQLPEITGQPHTTVVLDNVDISDSQHQTAGHVTTTTTLSDDFLLASMQKSMSEGNQSNDYGASIVHSIIKITDVTTNAQEGTITIQFTNGAAELVLKPQVKDGQISFESTNSTFLGINLSGDVNAAISEAISKQFSEATHGMRIDDAKVEDNGLTLRLSGDNVDLQELTHSTSPTP